MLIVNDEKVFEMAIHLQDNIRLDDNPNFFTVYNHSETALN